jgi:hypothetical protein
MHVVVVFPAHPLTIVPQIMVKLNMPLKPHCRFPPIKYFNEEFHLNIDHDQVNSFFCQLSSFEKLIFFLLLAKECQKLKLTKVLNFVICFPIFF